MAKGTLALKNRIYHEKRRAFDEAYERDHEVALRMNRSIDRVWAALHVTFSRELIQAIVNEGIAIEIVPKESPLEDGPDVIFKYPSGNTAINEDGDEYEIMLTMPIHLISEEQLLAEMQRRFRIIDDSPFLDWATIKRKQADQKYNEKLVDAVEDLYSRKMGTNIASEFKGRQGNPFNPSPRDIQNKLDAAPTFRMAPEDTGGVDEELQAEVQGKTMMEMLDEQTKDREPSDRSHHPYDPEENEFIEVEKEAEKMVREELKEKMAQAEQANNLGYDFQASGTNHPPGAVIVPEADEQNYTDFTCRDCGMNLLFTSDYYYCTYCETKFSKRMVEVDQNEG